MQAIRKNMAAKKSVLLVLVIYTFTQSVGAVLAESADAPLPATAEAPASGNFFSKIGASAKKLFSKSTGTSIQHKPVAYITPDKRTRLEASVKDAKGISLVRVYFKADNQADYLFVPMETTTAGSYSAILPGMAKGAKSLDYLFLAVNNDNQVVKTQVFSVKQKEDKDAPSWQMVKSDGDIQVWTELGKAPAVAESFSDSIAMNAVESGGRFGVVAGLYEGSTSAATSGAAGSASSAGTVTAAAGGLSTAAIVGAAVVGGAAAAGGGGGGGGTTTPLSSVCNVNQTSNGSGSQTIPIDFGSASRPINFQMMMTPYSATDRFRVMHDGQEIYSSGFICSNTNACFPSGTVVGAPYASPKLIITTGSSQITVIIDQPSGSTGSVWDFLISC